MTLPDEAHGAGADFASRLPTDDHSLDDAAVAYAEMGLRVLPVWGIRKARDGAPRCLCGSSKCKKGKHPIGDRWERLATTDADRVRQARQGKPGANIGLAMGGLERLVAVDIDGAQGRASYDALEAAHGAAPVTLTSATGREDGGEHRVFRVPEHLDITRLKNRASVNDHLGIDTRTSGGQIVVAPSMHESGQRYRWTVRAPIADLPEWLFEALASPLATVTSLIPRAPGSRPASGSPARDFAWRYVEKALENAAADIAACPPGQRNDKLFAKSCTVFEYFIGERFDPLVAWNRLHDAGRACGMSETEVRTTLAKARKRSESTPRHAPAMPERPDHAYRPSPADVPFEERARGAPEESDDLDPTWDSDLEHDRKGNLKCTLANLVTILARHPAWRGVIVWDDFAQTIVKQKFPPVREGDRSPKIALGEWNEGDTGRAVTWISKEFKIDTAPRAVEEALVIVAERTTIHPVRDYLAALVWDGTARLDTFLSTHFGASDSDYARGIASRWMISAVARAHEPGCKADCTLVLESAKQGIGKSSGIQALVPDVSWFADTPLTIGSVDSYQCLRAKWIYELGELAGLKGRDVERIKNFLSAPSDTFRSSYGKRSKDSPRQLIFAATTNERHGYLVDRTGNRRFWPVEVTLVDRAAIVRDRDQLWAEATHRYRAGEAWHVNTPEFRALCEEEQAERVPDHPWRGPVEAWLEHPWVTVYDPADGLKKSTKADLEGEGVTTTDVLQSVIGMRLTDIDRRREADMGQVLRELGFDTWRPRGDSRQRRYRLPSLHGDGPTGGGGGWTGVGPEYHQTNHAVTVVVQPVQPISTYTQGEKNEERKSLEVPEQHFGVGPLDHPAKTASPCVGAVAPNRAEASHSPVDKSVEVRPGPTPSDMRALSGILARVKGRGTGAAMPTGAATGSPPRAPGSVAPPPPSPTTGPPRLGTVAPRPSPELAPPPRAPLDDEPDDLLTWLLDQA